MHLKVSIALCVMLSKAIGWTKENRPEMARSLLKAG